MSLETENQAAEEAVNNEAEQADATEAVEQVTVDAPSQDDAAFEAGFAAGSGDEEPQPEPEAEPQPLPELEIAGYTESQIKDLLQKAAEVDRLREAQAKAFGALGSLKQSIDALRNQPRPSATAVKLTKEKLARLGQAFPEMAEMLAEDLSGVLTGGAEPADTRQYEQLVDQKLSQTMQQQQRQMEAKLLTVMHNDWQQVAASEEFKAWTATLPPQDRQQLAETWDAVFIGSKIAEFKAQANKTAQANQSKQRRLAQAITPKGSPTPPAQTDEDAFFAGFKAARGR